MIDYIFQHLASDAGRNFKLDVLRQHKNNHTLRQVIFLALDPFTQFYIRKIPAYKTTTRETETLEWAISRLQKLSRREITGNAAIDHLKLILESVAADDAKVIERVIAKDLKCGVSEATANAVWPGLIHEYPCMLASAYDDKLVNKIEFPAFVQLKLDGMRFNAIVRNGQVEFRSRNGKEIAIADPIFALPFIHMASVYGQDCVFDGELLVTDERGKPLDRKTGNGILNKAVKGTQSNAEGQLVHATLWDVVPFHQFQQGFDPTQYDVRLNKLVQCVEKFAGQSAQLAHRISICPTEIAQSLDVAIRKFDKYLAEGQEGIILKSTSMVWENKRSKDQIKFKGELECDLAVVDWEEGTGKNAGRLGALVLSSADGLLRVKVGTGFTDSDRDSIGRDVIGKIVATKYNSRITDKRTGSHSLFLPVFVGWRLDKDEADHSEDIK